MVTMQWLSNPNNAYYHQSAIRACIVRACVDLVHAYQCYGIGIDNRPIV